MRVLLQRVTHAAVAVDGVDVGRIGRGYLLLVGIGRSDDASQVDRMASKIVNMRLFPDQQGRFDRSLLDIGGEALVVSQFTLYADVRQGRRPGFSDARTPDEARALCDRFAQQLRELGVVNVESGQFGAAMAVTLCNDGPVTIWLDSDDWA